MENNVKQEQQNTGTDRRGFLKAAALAGAGAAWTLGGGPAASVALAGSANRRQSTASADFTFVQISDTHIGFKQAANPNVTRTFEEAIQRLNALPQRPAFVVHTGDHVHLSRPVEFDTVKQLMGTIKADRVFSIPGEHDVFLDQGKRYRQLFAKGTIGTGYWSFDLNGVHFIGLVNDSGAVGKGQGTLGAEQLSFIKKDLSGLSADTPLVLFSHVPLLPVYVPWGWSTSDSAALLALVSRFTAVTALNGHIHQIISKQAGNVTMHTTNATSYPDHAPGHGTPTALVVPAGTLPKRIGLRVGSFAPGALAPMVANQTLG